MADDIFGNEVPKYWDRGLPAMPSNGKEAIIEGWPGLLGGTPSEPKRAEWLGKYRKKDLALLTGHEFIPGWRIDALDVDDGRILKLVLHLLGLNRAERRAILAGKRGKKGATIFVRAPKLLKSTVIKGAGGLGNIDFLAAGKMTIMPPSIHPDTGKPYEVFGKSLLDVDFAELPELTERHVKLLKATIGSEHAIVLIEGKATHDAGVALVAILVRAGATDEEITAIIEGLLPDGYDGDSLKELPEWIRSAREKGFDEDEAEGDTVSARIVRLALGQEITLFRDEAHRDIALATLPHTGSAIVYRVKTSAVKLWLRHIIHKAWGTPVGSNPLSEAIATMEAIALFDGKAFPVNARVAGDMKTVAVDLGHDDGRVAGRDTPWPVRGLCRRPVCPDNGESGAGH